ncbi:hypothetical protein, partial [Moorena sp. SIO3I8]|uniref:hypothetical protein n=1 Tax=Moorena sp. SIO3I8 TaxID=2607833 RepID=UPI0025E8A84B
MKDFFGWCVSIPANCFESLPLLCTQCNLVPSSSTHGSHRSLALLHYFNMVTPLQNFYKDELHPMGSGGAIAFLMVLSNLWR